MFGSSGIQKSAVQFSRGTVVAAAESWSTVIRGEYLVVPTLTLTLAQVQQLWDLDEATSIAAIDALCERRFLMQTPAGAYVRATH